tara:strand:- start:2088 stop:2621 length:534 start_codon:yes stop_codon:yes gene_type:complete
MSAGLAILEFFKNPYYNRLISRAARKGATVEAQGFLKDQISTLAAINIEVGTTEVYGLYQDIINPGKHIAPMVNAQTITAPRIVYQVLDVNGSPTKYSGSNLDRAQVKISCHSNRYEQAALLMAEIRALFERYQGTLATVKLQSVDFITELDSFSDDADLVGVSHDYNLRIERDGSY